MIRRRCIYCGARTRSRISVCHAHSDLPAIDAGYMAGFAGLRAASVEIGYQRAWRLGAQRRRGLSA